MLDRNEVKSVVLEVLQDVRDRVRAHQDLRPGVSVDDLLRLVLEDLSEMYDRDLENTRAFEAVR